MDDQLALRIRLFRESGQVRPEVADFVAAELDLLSAAGRTVTEASAGMLTSHLMGALTRLLDGASVEERDTDALIGAELTDHPEAVALARAVSHRAERALGAPLPDSEIHFLGLHLAVIGRPGA
ncbi:PRD domain-containing protein [Streptomyces purpureus]|uniref:PRD domain-containing protein n=1 Tax=Streptomyces purpureus TaxID=1951 RepID=A0A918LNJ5_9ACTN|nr:PRD domain-containing protein [Streptomyces purpureus]GGT30501.1 hypothetical protein GCM10014713_25140 [Streptomyces purpureus]